MVSSNEENNLSMRMSGQQSVTYVSKKLLKNTCWLTGGKLWATKVYKAIVCTRLHWDALLAIRDVTRKNKFTWLRLLWLNNCQVAKIFTNKHSKCIPIQSPTPQYNQNAISCADVFDASFMKTISLESEAKTSKNVHHCQARRQGGFPRFLETPWTVLN